MNSNFFLTGSPRSGKSSLIQKYLSIINVKPAGFIVQRLLLGNKTRGFRLADLSEEPYRLSLPYKGRTSSLLIYKKEGEKKWKPVISTFDQAGRRALEKGAGKKLVIMDELGIFEKEASLFQKAVFDRLNAPETVLGVIKNKQSPFLNQIRQMKDMHIASVEDPKTPQQLEKFLQERGLLPL